MRKYENLPSINVELLDGNLIIDEPVTGPVVLIIGTAYSGPTNTQYLAADSNVASRIYGADSPLIRKMSEAKMTGAKNVLLYRIGGAAAELIDILGSDTLIGTKEQTASAGSRYGLYLGPSPANPAVSGLIVYEGDKIVYSDMVGSEIDLGVMNVVGDTKTFTTNTGITIGTTDEPVLLKDVMSSLATSIEVITIEDTPSTAYALDLTTVNVTAVDVNAGPALTEGVDYTLSGATGVDLTITMTGSVAANLVTGDSINVTADDNAAGDTSEVLSVVDSGVSKDVYALDVNTSSVTAVDNAGTDLVEGTDYSISGLAGSLYITFDVPQGIASMINVNGVPIDIPGFDPDPYYLSGSDNVGASWRKRYELLAEAYSDLETTIATHMIVDRAIIDAPNIADGNLDADALAYVRTTETDGVIEYIWSVDRTIYVDVAGTGETNDPLLASVDENGKPIIKYQYNEVNFGHQLGSWLNSITENDRFILGVIGTSAPLAATTASISKWVGTLPTIDALGVTVSNGSGLLGNRYMVGSTTQTAGYYATDSGYPDGNIQYDSNGAAVDVGKFMSVVMGLGLTPESPTLGTVAQTVNSASLYAGLLSTILPGQSTTNRLLPGAAVPFSLKKTKLDELSFAGYVSVTEKARGTVIVSGELPTGPNSDYDYVSTSIIIGGVVKDIRDRLDPFIGNSLNDITLAAADTAVESILQDYVRRGAIVKYGYQVVSDPAAKGKGEMRIPLTIVPAFELRQISVSIKLAYDI